METLHKCQSLFSATIWASSLDVLHWHTAPDRDIPALRSTKKWHLVSYHSFRRGSVKAQALFYFFPSDFRMHIFSFLSKQLESVHMRLRWNSQHASSFLWHFAANKCFDAIQLNCRWDLLARCVMGNETVDVFNNRSARCTLTSFPGNFQMPQHLILKR